MYWVLLSNLWDNLNKNTKPKRLTFPFFFRKCRLSSFWENQTVASSVADLRRRHCGHIWAHLTRFTRLLGFASVLPSQLISFISAPVIESRKNISVTHSTRLNEQEESKSSNSYLCLLVWSKCQRKRIIYAFWRRSESSKAWQKESPFIDCWAHKNTHKISSLVTCFRY